MDVFDHTAAILNYIVVEFYCYYGMLRKQMHTNLTPPTPRASHNSYLKQHKFKHGRRKGPLHDM